MVIEISTITFSAYYKFSSDWLSKCCPELIINACGGWILNNGISVGTNSHTRTKKNMTDKVKYVCECVNTYIN